MKRAVASATKNVKKNIAKPVTGNKAASNGGIHDIPVTGNKAASNGGVHDIPVTGNKAASNGGIHDTPVTEATKCETTVPEEVEEVLPVAKTPRKRESKKKFPVVAVVTPDGIEGCFMSESRRPLIAHLPIKSTEVIFYDVPISYDPKPPGEPKPYDGEFEVYETTSETVQHQDTIYENAPESTSAPTLESATLTTPTSASATAPPSPSATPEFSKAELLVSFKNTNKSQSLPESTKVACFWCCNQFEGRPCVIPIREEKGIYEVYGNFCCPECSLAYILDERDDSHVKWEKISLLHRIYGACVSPGGGRIYPAPARNTLEMFGGTLTIDNYRKTIRDGKVRIDIHLPPMISILATMDTKPIDFYETTIPKSFVPLNNERVQKVEEGLRLKRSKPLKDRESTLDAVMNLQIRRLPSVNPLNLTGANAFM